MVCLDKSKLRVDFKYILIRIWIYRKKNTKNRIFKELYKETKFIIKILKKIKATKKKKKKIKATEKKI